MLPQSSDRNYSRPDEASSRRIKIHDPTTSAPAPRLITCSRVRHCTVCNGRFIHIINAIDAKRRTGVTFVGNIRIEDGSWSCVRTRSRRGSITNYIFNVDDTAAEPLLRKDPLSI
ncbi:hypothetical protein EVAR_19993_1 [Eumeta japonica]|uniref:Uncharacterized protein n=1 Tax=Eumeta variegata TaxID=151549 RepID=A0A4C1V9T1_EUMVA|nr:hypothetical protein EVAR_19993_1 [Eumeta japonica]